jgi:4-amino-4-deoxy-L-arabinose transferase-like glycosyltransferase
MEFLGDQGRDVLIVRRFLKQGDLMFIGPQTSIGNMYLGPWYYYLIAPSLLLVNFNPIGPAVFNALVGVASVYFIWHIGKKWFNNKVGIISAILAAFSPVMIKYSTFSWNPNVMPLLSLLAVWFTWRVWQKDDYKSLIWLAVSLALVLNSHYLGLLLFPVVGVFILLKLIKLFRGKENKQQRLTFLKVGILSIGIFLLLMSPLLIFDLKHDFANYNAFKEFFTVRQTTVNLKVYKGLTDLPKLFSQLTAQTILNQDKWKYALLFLPILILGIVKSKNKQPVWLIVLWLVIGILGLGNYKQHIYAHYYLFLYPSFILLTSLGLTKIKWIGPLIGLVITIIMISNWHGWGQPVYQLRRARNVAKFIEEKSNNQKFALGLIAEQNYDDPYRYFLTRKKKNNLVDLHNQMTDQLFVICEPWGKVDCNPIGHEKWQIAAFGWAEIANEWQVENVQVYKLVHQE